MTELGLPTHSEWQNSTWCSFPGSELGWILEIKGSSLVMNLLGTPRQGRTSQKLKHQGWAGSSGPGSLCTKHLRILSFLSRHPVQPGSRNQLRHYLWGRQWALFCVVVKSLNVYIILLELRSSKHILYAHTHIGTCLCIYIAHQLASQNKENPL